MLQIDNKDQLNANRPHKKLLQYDHFIDFLNQIFSSDTTSQKTYIAFLFIEFDNPVHFNDMLDFDTDDKLMAQIVEKVNLLLRHKDILAKASDNQYIIMQDLSESSGPGVLAKDIIHMLSEPFVIGENMLYINASIGISYYPLDGDKAYRVIKKAKNSMGRAKKYGKNNIAFAKQKETLSSYKKSVRIMADLPTAIENGDIYFVYQPQYSYNKKCFVGAEMLARWEHPVYQEVSPEFFIPLAEKNGMIVPLTLKAIIDASKTFAILENEGMNDFSLSVNISPVFLMRNTFYETIEFLIEQYPLKGKNLNFEITEEVLLTNSKYLQQVLEKINTLNVNIELDDFGTGYTSLQHLAHLPINTLKVDKSFIRNIDQDTKKRAIFKAITDMAHALNIDIVAEGVENSAEDKIVSTFKSTKVQGFFYSMPLPRDVLIEKMKQLKR